MSAPLPSLPQNDSPAQQQQRRLALSQQQQIYTYNFDSRLRPLGIATQVPSQDSPAFAWFDAFVTTVIQLLGNYLSIATKHFHQGKVLANERTASWSEREFLQAEAFFKELSDGLRDLTALSSQLHQAPRTTAPAVAVGVARHSMLMDLAGRVVEDVTEVVAATVAEPVVFLEAHVLALRIKSRVDDLHQKLLSDSGNLFAALLGLYGPARAMSDYATPFSVMLLPSIASNFDTDRMFARMRLAGPNPLVIRRVDAPDARFPVTEAHYQAAMTDGEDSLERAGKEGRLYLADYQVFEGCTAGKTSGGQKYIEAPLALFVVPRSGATSERWLRPVAIQLSQEAGAPIFTPADGASWSLARLHVQVADGNYHELISHLGLTHLVLEEFTLATYRQLSVQHPLYLLLTPHFQGTLSINDGAEKSLIAPGGPVDLMLALEIETATRVCVNAVAAHRINDAFLPKALALRGVDDVHALPDYPYRDDGLLVWKDIQTWVGEYLSIYYPDDAAVRDDQELQGWVRELSSKTGGQLQDIGEQGEGIRSLEYLTELLTYVIFTASAQHATVNFPQRPIMSYTPAMPLAAYAPAPTGVEPRLPESAQLAHLPPLQMALLQQLVGVGLGSIYFTRLGAYDAYLEGHWFQDPRVAPLLSRFQERLGVTERTIGERNLSRIPYDTLLPSAIPQSINI